MLSPRIGVYTGSFDPVTLGHLHIIRRAARLFDELILGIGINATKQPLFSLEERIALIQLVTKDLKNVRVESFSGLAVEYVRRSGSCVMVRGVRPMTDIAGEFTMMMANRQLDREIETVCLMADEDYTHVSSTLIKQIAAMSDAKALLKFVPEEVIPALLAKLQGGTGADPSARTSMDD